MEAKQMMFTLQLGINKKHICKKTFQTLFDTQVTNQESFLFILMSKQPKRHKMQQKNAAYPVTMMAVLQVSRGSTMLNSLVFDPKERDQTRVFLVREEKD